MRLPACDAISRGIRVRDGDDDRKFHLGFKYDNPRGFVSWGDQVVFAPSVEEAARRIASERDLKELTITKRYFSGRPASEAEIINKTFRF